MINKSPLNYVYTGYTTVDLTTFNKQNFKLLTSIKFQSFDFGDS